MKKAILIICILFSITIYSQEFKIKKIVSPEFGNVPSGKTFITLTDSIITIKTKKVEKQITVNYFEEIDDQKIYTGNYGKNIIRYTLFKNRNYIKFENKEDLSGKVNELYYYF